MTTLSAPAFPSKHARGIIDHAALDRGALDPEREKRRSRVGSVGGGRTTRSFREKWPGTGQVLFALAEGTTRRSTHIVLGVVLAAWSALIAIGASFHEPWWDEAQAWLIARDASLVELLSHVVRYEGHPPLWYLILAIPAKAGLPYWSLKLVGAGFGGLTVCLLLYGFPRVPIFIRVLAPFAFFVAYQYTIVARSYVLLGPLLLLIARIYSRRAEMPGRYACLLILLSHVSVHGFAIACGLAALFSIEALAGRVASPPRRVLIAGAAFALNGALLLLALWPPREPSKSYEYLHSPLSLQRHVQVVSSIVPPLFWGPVGDETMSSALAMVAAAVVAMAVLIAWFFHRGAGWPFVIGALGSYAIALRYMSMWHEGIFFLLILFGAMLSFGSRPASRWLEVAGRCCLILLLLRQAQWALLSLAHDIGHDVTGSARAAQYITERGLDRRGLYGMGIEAVELQPYFPRNIFINYRQSGRGYWEWSSRNEWPLADPSDAGRREMSVWFARLLADRPAFIVVGEGMSESGLYVAALSRHPGYRRVATFGGDAFWKTRPWSFHAFHVYESVRRPGLRTPPAPTPQAARPPDPR